MGNGCGCITAMHFFRQPSRYGNMMMKIQEFMQTEQSHTGYDTLPTDVLVLSLKMAQQSHVQLIVRAEAGMPAFGGEGVV